jgi:two-component system response regulator YesN
MEQAMRTYLKIRVQASSVPVDGTFGGVPAAYQAARSNVYRRSQPSPVAKRGRQIIHERYADPDLTLEAIAHELHVSPIYLSRMFKQEFGMAFAQLLSTVRIQKAIQLLSSTDKPIHEIAELAGYQNQHYFSTAFKKMTGASPNQYRRGCGLV